MCFCWSLFLFIIRYDSCFSSGFAGWYLAMQSDFELIIFIHIFNFSYTVSYFLLNVYISIFFTYWDDRKIAMILVNELFNNECQAIWRRHSRPYWIWIYSTINVCVGNLNFLAFYHWIVIMLLLNMISFFVRNRKTYLLFSFSLSC